MVRTVGAVNRRSAPAPKTGASCAVLFGLVRELFAQPLRRARARGRLARALALARAGEPVAAAELERVLALDPGNADAWLELGNVLYLQGDAGRAETCYRRALALAPEWPAARLNLGRVLRESGRNDEAIVHLRRAWAGEPGREGALRQLVGALLEADHLERALAVARAQAGRTPQDFEAQLLLGFVHAKRHEPLAALECYERARRIRPEDAEVYDLRASALLELGRLDEALADFDRALALRPDFPLARFHRALARLLVGDFARGWEDYELRRSSGDFAPHPASAPAWDGSALAGRTILVRREQGLGDEIMFASMLPEIVAAAGACILECEPRLRGLFARSFPRATVFAALPDRGLPPPIARLRADVEVAAGSLGRFLRRHRSDFPRHGGYLAADPARVAAWRERLAALGPGLKVGISWTGGLRRTRRALRSIPLAELAPVLEVPGVRFVSVQYTEGAADEAAAFAARHGVPIAHWPEAIADYDETAALVVALDLVLSVCTSVVHLAGALGRPAWVMVPVGPEWRYGFRDDAMVWYPSVRLFRQRAYRDWQPVIAEVAAALSALASARGRS